MTPIPELVERAELLIEALPYIRAFQGKTLVIKYGGAAMEQADLKEQFAKDVLLLRLVGIRPVIVHGGGPQIGAPMKRVRKGTEHLGRRRPAAQRTAEIVEKLVHLTDVTGINGEDGRLVSTLTKREAERLIKAGVIDGGMLPKVESSLRALTGGAQKAHIIDGRVPHAILLEVLTKEGIGTEIVL